MDWARFDQEAERLRLLNLLVWKDGKEVLRRDYDGEIRRNQYSVTKSFTSIAVGIAEREGLLSLDEPLLEAFPEEAPENPLPEPAKGHGAGPAHHVPGPGAGLPHGGAAALPPRAGLGAVLPGSVLPLRAGGEIRVQQRGALSRRHSGPAPGGLRFGQLPWTPRLFAPLGIQRPTWETDPLGCKFRRGRAVPHGVGAHQGGPTAFAAGRWNGKQLIPAAMCRRPPPNRWRTGPRATATCSGGGRTTPTGRTGSTASSPSSSPRRAWCWAPTPSPGPRASCWTCWSGSEKPCWQPETEFSAKKRGQAVWACPRFRYFFHRERWGSASL